MQKLVIPTPPPNMDSFAPEFCHCGERTVESHEFWYCSTKCAIQDSLRSLGEYQCHYRENVRKGYAQASAQGPHPRRMMSADHLRHTAPERRGFTNASPRIPLPKNLLRRNPTTPLQDVRDRNMAGYPTLSQITRKVLIQKANAGETLVAARQDLQKCDVLPIAPSRARSIKKHQEHTFQPISPGSIPSLEHDLPRSPRCVPQANESLKNGIRKSIAALLNVKSRKGENPERIFGQPVNIFVPPARKESLPPHYGSPLADSTPNPKALRRSVSFAGPDTNPHNNPSTEDPLMLIIEELRAEVSESFDPKSLFERDDPY